MTVQPNHSMNRLPFRGTVITSGQALWCQFSSPATVSSQAALVAAALRWTACHTMLLLSLLPTGQSGFACAQTMKGCHDWGIAQFELENTDGIETIATITQRFEIYDPHSENDLQAVRDMGFTQVILDQPNLHRQASELGLDVVIANWWDKHTRQEVIERTLNLAQRVDQDRLVAISMMDEPERWAQDTPFSFYKNLYEQLRARLDQLLPTVKLEISHWGPLHDWEKHAYERFVPLYQAADNMRIMPYPDLHEGPLSEVYRMMQRSRKLMKMAGRDLKLVVILQTWVLPDDPQLPTIDELRVMAYQAMLAGADILSFFEYQPQVWQKTPGFTERFAQLMQELIGLSQRLDGARIESRMTVNGVMIAKVTMPDGNTSAIQVNTNRTAIGGLDALAVVQLQCSSETSISRGRRPRAAAGRRWFGQWRLPTFRRCSIWR